MDPDDSVRRVPNSVGAPGPGEQRLHRALNKGDIGDAADERRANGIGLT
jgi:hypothetical protein